MTDAINKMSTEEAHRIVGDELIGGKWTPLAEKAIELQHDLGLGGLWKDSEKVLAIIIKSFKGLEHK